MRKLKLYLYPHAPPHVHDSISAYRNSVPFSEDGIEEWCDLVGPDRAELYYCGQYADRDRWMLEPVRFGLFDGNESRHVFDLEGDESHKSFRPWMRDSIITAMNAEPNHRNWNCLVRPGCSMLLMEMVRSPPALSYPEGHGFYFRGQRDPHGVRERLRQALLLSGVPHQFEFMPTWNAPTDPSHGDVQRYVREMRRWDMALCPSGTGQMSVRYFEACALRRCPVVVAENLLFEESSSHICRIAPSLTVEQMARRLDAVYRADTEGVIILAAYAHSNFMVNIVPYFADPTLFMLARLQVQGLLDGMEWYRVLKERHHDKHLKN